MKSLDEALLRVARTAAHTPARERAVASFSALGEHAAIWLAFGAGASVVAAPRRRGRWRSATATVAAAYLAQHRRQARRAPSAAAARRICRR